MGTYLMLGSGAFWILTYILLIQRGFKDQTYRMPLVALCANLSWEFIFSFIHPHQPPQLQINIVWLMLDLIILYEFFKFGQSELKDIPKKLFYPVFILTLFTSFCCVLLITDEFQDWSGAYTAFGQNLLMSILFIDMLTKRNTVRGQSIFIAIIKMRGTLLASIGFYINHPTQGRSLLFIFLYTAIFVFDLIYVGMIAMKIKSLEKKKLNRALTRQ
ncbi:hypothetical protein H6G95_38165 [Nostoc linckia FACHB-391]|uniref:Uncharacterized protein n=1 Tax=Nostoc linckia FACHB-391 TaxID=2692906 RepID=A0ABR8FBL1_NOSLI|nr:hypothetical protein [Nostoc linckia]MBD2566260.1 hypothetical protein [Nostoc linckia FACHB-391]